jgi:hypothetical protein
VVAATPAQCAAWETRVRAMCARLGWPAPQVAARRSVNDTSLAFTAPVDQLLAATEVGEWAWQNLRLQEARAERDPGSAVAALPPLPRAPGAPAAWDEDAALETLQRLARAEARPLERALRDEARRRAIACLVDDDALSLGEGNGSRTWPLAELPRVEAVEWTALHDVPVALVTGSNGKTTTVRLVAAMLEAGGRRPGFNCTDGVFVGGVAVEQGDWSGPAGARAVLRDARVEAAVLETARGGLLRRGLAVERADAAIITNLSADHFGEYGVDDLDTLAEAKLVVARALGAGGRLVLNADDVVLTRHAGTRERAKAWFAADDDHPRLLQARADGEPTCAPRDGILRLTDADGTAHALGELRDDAAAARRRCRLQPRQPGGRGARRACAGRAGRGDRPGLRRLRRAPRRQSRPPRTLGVRRHRGAARLRAQPRGPRGPARRRAAPEARRRAAAAAARPGRQTATTARSPTLRASPPRPRRRACASRTSPDTCVVAPPAKWRRC